MLMERIFPENMAPSLSHFLHSTPCTHPLKEDQLPVAYSFESRVDWACHSWQVSWREGTFDPVRTVVKFLSPDDVDLGLTDVHFNQSTSDRSVLVVQL